jgi:hypothetical protein
LIRKKKEGSDVVGASSEETKIFDVLEISSSTTTHEFKNQVLIKNIMLTYHTRNKFHCYYRNRKKKTAWEMGVSFPFFLRTLGYTLLDFQRQAFAIRLLDIAPHDFVQ